MSNFTCESKSFINIFSTCQVSACELQPFSCHKLANDIYSETAKTVFSHLNSKTTTSHVHHTFLYISFPFLHDYDVKCLISRFMEDVDKQRRNYISLSEFGYGPLKFSFRRVRLLLTK